MASGMQVRVLGPVDVTIDGVASPIRGLRRKAVLAVLALHPGEVVSSSRLVDLVWGDTPPATATNVLQRHISFLRSDLGAPGGIVARSAGYILNLPVDAAGIRQVIQSSARDEQLRDHALAASRLRAALDLWRGPSLVDVTEVGWLRDQARRLDELRLNGTERLIEARLALGEHQSVVPELERLAAEHPFREHLYKLWMLALYRCGRQADALAVFQRLRRTLDDELGIRPGPALRELEAAILRQDGSLDLPAPAVETSPVSSRRVAPAQLPHDVGGFAGRRGELAWLHGHLSVVVNGDPVAPRTAVCVVSGAGGVGKTALAIHWAHQIKGQFPDGQLYVDLRGANPSEHAMDAGQVIRGFLDALDVPVDRIPNDPGAQAGLYRSLVADRRVLIVLDNARDEQQVRPLLPGAGGCLVVVTSRHQLSGLVVTDGAYSSVLDLPSVSEARDMLAARLDAKRVAAEPDAVDEIIARCGRLPLALAVAAARADMHRTRSLGQLAAQLAAVSNALDAFDGDDPATNVRTVFFWSYRVLSDPAARQFRLLSICPGPDIAVPAACSLAGLPEPAVRPLLAELARTHLITETAPDRFAFHDLLRAYAIEQAQLQDSPGERAAARRRLLDHYVHTAHAGSLLVRPARRPIELADSVPGAVPHRLANRDDALRWFTTEHQVLLAVATREADECDQHTWQLAWALFSYLHMRCRWQENERVQRAALLAALRLGDRTAQAYTHRSLGKAYAELGRLADAEHDARLALGLFDRADDLAAIADVQIILSDIAERRGDLTRALSYAEGAYRSHRAQNNLPGLAYAGNAVGWYHGRLGNHHNGLAYCQEALDAFIEIGDIEGTAATWDSLGALYFHAGQAERGANCYHEAITLYAKLEDHYGEADTYASLAEAYQHAGNLEAANGARRQLYDMLDDLPPEAADKIESRIGASRCLSQTPPDMQRPTVTA